MAKGTVFITGGAGYVGSVLIPKLLKADYKVKNLDLYLYGDDVLKNSPNAENLTEIKGDIRDKELLEREIAGCDYVIHLACISNDPSFELNPNLGKSINFDAFRPLVEISRQHGVKRFIYASSSSVYGVKEEDNVNEEMSLEPLTDYSKFKAMCEDVLQEYLSDDFITCTIRPATVCGFSPRLRLDLTVNILTNHAVNNGLIKVFGGEQKRPNIHIEDMTDLYVELLTMDSQKINGKIFNAGYDNFKVREIAEMVRNVVGGDNVKIETTSTDDNRSYHISSEKIKRELGFVPKRGIEQAVKDLNAAFQAGQIPNSFENPLYFNIKTMQGVGLQ